MKFFDKLEKLITNKYFLLILAFFCINVFTHQIAFISDDGQNLFDLANVNPITFIIERYQNWSSRVIPDLLMVIALKLPFYVSYAIVAMSEAFFVYSVTKLFNVKNNNLLLILSSFVAIITTTTPFLIDCGFIATNFNYFIPFAFLTFAFSKIFDVYNNKDISNYILAIVALIIGCSVEQGVAFSIGLISVLNLLYLIKNKRINTKLLTFLLVSIGCLLVIILCPGNDIRKMEEITKFDPFYGDYRILTKLKIGILYLAKNEMMAKILVPLGLVLTLLSIKERNIVTLILSLWLLYLCLIPIEEIIRVTNQEIVPVESVIQPVYLNTEESLVKEICNRNLLTILIASALLLVLVSKHKLIITISFIGAIMTKIMMGFSPTYHASSYRPFIAMIIIIALIAIYILFKEILENNTNENTN